MPTHRRRFCALALAPLLLLFGCQQETPGPSSTPSVASGGAAAVPVSGIPPAPEGTFKIGLVTPGKITDTAWSGPANDAVAALKDRLSAAPSPTIEAPGNADVEGAIQKLAADGNQLIFLHGSEYDAPAKSVAGKFPKATFAVVGGRESGPNLTPIQFQPGQATYLAGMVAGGMSKKNKVGCVGGDEIPIIKEAFAVFEKGVKAVNPAAEVKVVFTGDGNDIAKAKQAAEGLLAEGCDVITHNANAGGQGVAQAIMEKGGLFIGANSDQSDLATPRNLGSFVLDIKAAYAHVATKVKAGEGEGKPYAMGLKEKAVYFLFNPRCTTPIPAELKKKVAQAEADIISGKVVP